MTTTIERARLAELMARELARFAHLYALNRGVLLTPFHTMALMSPATIEEDVGAHSHVFEGMCGELAS